MDFFEAQDAARKRTSALIALFVMAVLAIIAVVYVVAHIGVGDRTARIDFFLLAQVAFGVGVVIAVGTGIRTASLRRGGPAVAELLGGRRVPSDTSDPDERKLINVVEEISIASGTPVPAVYVLDGEDGINAFAAGYSTHDAAVAVTRGGLQSLTRDELQGVIAHEFSHIFNGDMRLNIRLMGVLYGILLLSVVGRGIVYTSRGGGGRRGGSGGAGWVVILGLVLLLVGYIGVFFGKMIKAAVSRQREYLADSAAVQFTRNPEGLAGALKKIGAQAAGSRIQDHHAEELSHLFFANGLRSSMFGLLSTHPPLNERIRRLDPSWSGDFTALPTAPEPEMTPARRQATRTIDPFRAAAVAQLAGPAALIGSVGAPTPDHLAYAAALLSRFPRALTQAVHDPVEARALILSLVVANERQLGADERAILRDYGGEELERQVEAMMPLVREQGADAPLPLLDLALPALLNLSPVEARRFRAAVERLVHADGRVRPFEYALIHTLARRLEEPDAPGSSRGGEIRSIDPLLGDVEAILSAVAWTGSDGSAEAASAAFDAAVQRLPTSAARLRLKETESVGFTRVDAALSEMERASPAVRRTFLEACAECVGHDRRLQTAEVELLRAIAEALDCPIPPLLAGGSAPSVEAPRG